MTGYTAYQTALSAASALTCACRENDSATAVEVLAAYPQALHWRSAATGKTALHIAIASDSREVSAVLIAAGADVMMADNEGVTPLSLLFRRGWQQASTTPPSPSVALLSRDAQGQVRFATDAKGHVLAENGAVVPFDTHKDASRWILTVGNRARVSQVFEMAVHPEQDGKLAVQARAMAVPAPAKG